MIQKIQEHLEENLRKKQKGLGKQMKTAVDIHTCLESEGYDISYGTVLRTIKSLVHTQKEAFIKAEHQPVCEFWGSLISRSQNHKWLYLRPHTVIFRMAYLFTKQKQSVFPVKVNGVFHTMVYDNMRVAVKNLLK